MRRDGRSAGVELTFFLATAVFFFTPALVRRSDATS
jgi:hypothetical protein